MTIYKNYGGTKNEIQKVFINDTLHSFDTV